MAATRIFVMRNNKTKRREAQAETADTEHNYGQTTMSSNEPQRSDRAPPQHDTIRALAVQKKGHQNCANQNWVPCVHRSTPKTNRPMHRLRKRCAECACGRAGKNYLSKRQLSDQTRVSFRFCGQTARILFFSSNHAIKQVKPKIQTKTNLRERDIVE